MGQIVGTLIYLYLLLGLTVPGEEAWAAEAALPPVTRDFLMRTWGTDERLPEIAALDSEWRDVGAIRQVTLQNLRPGHYQFRVRAAQFVWSEQDGTLGLTVLPSFWEQGWFRAAALLGLLGSVFGAYRRVQNLRWRRQGEEALREAYRLAQGTIDALLANICVLDGQGAITAINQAWLEFAQANGAKAREWKGINYLDVCAAVRGSDAVPAEAMASGIRGVLRGERKSFVMEYACPSPQKERWFVVRVTSFAVLRQVHAAVAHEDITDAKAAEQLLRQAHDQLELRVHERTADLEAANQLLEKSSDRLLSMSLRLVAVQEEERRSIARELHDQIGQILTSLRLVLEMSARQEPSSWPATMLEAKNMAGELMDRVRQLSLDLRPPMLDDLGLLPTLDWHFKGYTRQTGIAVRYAPPLIPGRLPPEIETAAFRLVQEALTNVARYAGVTEVAVGLCFDRDILYLSIIDRGVGFDVETVLAAASSNGISGMQERVALLFGQFCIVSIKGAGTSIQIELPMIAEDKRGVARSSVC